MSRTYGAWKSILFLLFSYFGTTVVCAQRNGQILKIEKVIYPGYDKIDDIKFYYTEPEYKTALQDRNLVTQKIYYWSDGLKVIAYLARPLRTNGKKLPVIIFNRGSYLRNDIAFVHIALFKKLVDSGFVVIAPALRQSEGGEGRDEVGGDDVHDIMNILPVLTTLPYSDTSRLFMLGESRGGMMTLQAMRDGFPLKAAAVIGAFTDLGQFVKDNPRMESLNEKIWTDYKENRDKLFEKRSAVNWADRLNAPLLIMTGNSDPQVKATHALQLAQKMEEFGKPYQLLILDGANHILSKQFTQERDRQTISWFKTHLK